MIFEQHRTGGDRNFSYLVGDVETAEAMVVDPSYEPQVLLERARELGLRIATIANTHPHMDHTAGNDRIRRATGARSMAFWGEEIVLADGDHIPMGRTIFRVIHTPGHTPHCICLLGEGKLLTGDTLFVGKVGGTDFDEGARQEYESLHRQLMVLPDETEVWPGHDYGVRPFSNMAREKRENPFLLCRSFEEFVDLKRNWLEYKRKHGIA